MSRRRPRGRSSRIWVRLILLADVVLGVALWRSEGAGAVVLAIALAAVFGAFLSTRSRRRRRA